MGESARWFPSPCRDGVPACQPTHPASQPSPVGSVRAAGGRAGADVIHLPRAVHESARPDWGSACHAAQEFRLQGVGLLRPAGFDPHPRLGCCALPSLHPGLSPRSTPRTCTTQSGVWDDCAGHGCFATTPICWRGARARAFLLLFRCSFRRRDGVRFWLARQQAAHARLDRQVRSLPQ